MFFSNSNYLEIPLFTEREQETVLEGEPIGTKVTQVNAIDKDGTFPNNQVRFSMVYTMRVSCLQCKAPFIKFATSTTTSSSSAPVHGSSFHFTETICMEFSVR